ncbi:MAG: response regulator [Verrucomicrobium sp.]|nr:response regulator [Verrucomicrobium sp.]
MAPADAPHILIAEDHRVTRQLLARMLDNLGQTYDMVDDGLHALDALRNKNYQLLFIDLSMPGLDGLETTRRIRSTPGREAAPRIVAVTAARQDRMRITCLANGMDDFLSKPILIADIQRVLQGRPSIHADEARLNLRRRLAELREMGGPVFVTELATLFFQEAEMRMEEVAVAEKAQDFPTLSRLFHQLQGGAVNLGASELHQICVVAEEAAERADGALVHGCHRLAAQELKTLSELVHTHIKE